MNLSACQLFSMSALQLAHLGACELVFGKVGNFWVILRCFEGVFRAMVRITKVLGMRRPPPPYVGKNSQIIPYFFSDAFPYHS